MSICFECKQLTKYFGGVKALNNVNIQLESGKIIGLLGPNGSGKTTLIKLTAGLLKQNSGEILINGIAPGEETKRFVSYLPERNFLNNSMRVNDGNNVFWFFNFCNSICKLHCNFYDYAKILQKFVYR